MKIRNFILVLVFFMSIFGITVFSIYNSKEAFIKRTSILCEKGTISDNQECLRENILNYVNKNPSATGELFDSIWKLLGKEEIINDARIFSPIIHEAGMILASKSTSLEAAMQMCSLNFRGGCIHGVFMEYVDRNYKKVDIEFLIKECVLLSSKNIINSDLILKNCIHAVGHELVANTKGTLNETLRLCNKLPDSLIGNCAYGVFMEYSTDVIGIGHHSEKAVGKNDFDCVSIDNSFKKECYTSLGFYKQYEVDSEPWEVTYRFCDSTPIKYRDDCFNGVDGALLFSTAFVKKKAEAVCKSLPEDVQGYCLRSM